MANPIPIQAIHANDKGLWFIVTVMDLQGVVDMSRATVIQYLFEKPDGSMLVVPASLVTDGTDGRVYYQTSVTDFDQVGTWKHQLYTEIGPDAKWSNITKFKVNANLPV